MTLLSNNNIRLRPLEPEDLDLLYEWENDSSLWTSGSTVSPYSRYTLKKYIAQSHLDIYEIRQLRLMIELIDAPAKGAGLIDLYDFDPHNSKAAIGILVGADHQGKGIAGQALALLVDYAFSFLKLHQLYAYIPVTNKASNNLFRRCGFIPSGTLTDWVSTSEGFTNVLFVQRINETDQWKTS
ncbi:MAG: GNAT family N-acetyltransferase [Tannerellaceae bacterium]|jgi:diamine N-acetyltransferase|nr:GNAT family N-acetyltransferase [Tannerellaceae bacterium]